MSAATSSVATQSTPSLRQRTTHGVMLVAGQAVVSRGVVLVQQLALAWLLTKSDFGLIGLTYTVTTFVQLMANPGIDAVLVQRSRQHRLWATPAFWLGLTASLLCVAFTLLIAAPVAAWAYGEPRLIGLIAVLALALPVQSLQIVPKAQLQVEMRFRALAGLILVNSVLTALFTILAAWAGLGAYSFVVPVPIVAALVAALAWWYTRPRVRLRTEFSRWKYLFRNSAAYGITQLLYVFDNQADYIALGLAGFTDILIGTYVFAFSVAVQPLRLLSSNIPVVLFPSLSHLSLDREKQVRAALRAMRLMALLIVPFCVLQIVVTEPAFRVLFPSRWLDAVLPCQILTFGMMVNSFCSPANSLMMAQGRFRELMLFAIAGSLLLVAILWGVMWLAPSIVGVAAAIAFWNCLHSPGLHILATYHIAAISSYCQEICRPIAAAGFAAVPAMLLQRLFPHTPGGSLLSIVVGGSVFAAVYAGLIHLIARSAMHDLYLQLQPFWSKLRRSTMTSS